MAEAVGRNAMGAKPGARIGGVIQSDYAHPVNPGNALGYNPTTTMFALYDANDPLRKILLNADGTLSKTGTGLEWALNFNDTVTYRGMMFTGVPNMVWVFGYFRASWTLRTDLVAEFVCRMLAHLKA